MSYQLPEEKPTWKTTEFIVTFLMLLLSVAVTMGWVPQTDVETLQGLITTAVEQIGVLTATALAIYQYIKSRTEVKKVREELKVLQVKERLTQK